MSLLDYIQQQPILQNQVIGAKSPVEKAYDEMLNRQQQARKQEKVDNLISGIGTGLNGLGKIIASATIKNPWQQGAVANSLNANDDRLQQQMREYAEKMAKQRTNYVDQAKEQLGLAKADEEKQYDRDIENKTYADKMKQYAQQIEAQKEKAKQDQKQQELENIIKKKELEDRLSNSKVSRDRTIAETEKINRENSPEYMQQQMEQRQKEEEQKRRQEQLKVYVDTAKDLFKQGYLSNEDMLAIERNPELAENLVQAHARVPFVKVPLPWKSSRRTKLDKDISLKNRNIEGL